VQQRLGAERSPLHAQDETAKTRPPRRSADL